MHNPTAGRGKHDKRELMAALANAGHHAIYQSTKKSDYKKALKKPADLVLAAGGDGTVGKVGCELIDSGIPLGVPISWRAVLVSSRRPKKSLPDSKPRNGERLTSALQEGRGANVIFLKAPEAACSRIIFGMRRGKLRRQKSFPKNKK